MKATGLNVTAEQTAAFVAAGNQLRTLREQKGLSQEKLAIEAGVDQSGLSKIERIGPQLSNWGRLIRIAQALDCTIEINFRPR
jgi:transcriptional regulator with XRE-family HTH domain